MANDNLNEPVIIAARQIEARSLPVGFTPAYIEYVIRQSSDLGNVARKANEAGQGAYDAQIKNDDQDAELADHEQRLTAAEGTLGNHEFRITTAENNISSLNTRMATAESDIDFITDELVDIEAELADHETRISANKADIDNIKSDYVSKSAVVNQIVQAGGGALIAGTVALPTTDKFQVGGSINISGVYKVNGTQVLTARQTGWTAATGTSFKGTFNADLAWTIGVLNVLQIQQIADALTEVRRRTKAIDDVLRTHGLIN